ncbi:hypothetical protein AB5I41_27740 [Sphingomonas sp. MMS24-JH45]
MARVTNGRRDAAVELRLDRVDGPLIGRLAAGNTARPAAGSIATWP